MFLLMLLLLLLLFLMLLTVVCEEGYVDIAVIFVVVVVVIDIIVGGGLRRRRDVVPGNYKGIRSCTAACLPSETFGTLECVFVFWECVYLIFLCLHGDGEFSQDPNLYYVIKARSCKSCEFLCN